MIRLLALAIACAAAAASAPASASAIQVTAIYAGPIEASSQCNPEGAGAVAQLQAGAVEDFCFALRTQTTPATGDHLRRVGIDAPAGVLANVDSAPQCTLSAFAVSSGSAAACSVDTQVGAASASIRAQLAGSLELPLAVVGKVYNLEHSVDEVGLLGLQLDPDLLGVGLPKVKVLLRFTLRPAPDVGLRAVADNLPTKADTGILGVKPIAIDTFGFRFWGSRLDHPTMTASFTRMASRCGPTTTAMDAVSYADDVSTLSATYQSTGCEHLELGQRTTLSTSEARPDVPTEATIELRPVPAANPDVLEAANVDRAVVTLPPGLMLGAQVASGADGLTLCSEAQFAAASNAPPACPQASEVATVTFVSPNLAVPFTGRAYLGPQLGSNRLPQLLISADQGGAADDAPRVKVVGGLAIDPQGRLVATIRDIPDVPFSLFKLTFRGGTHGVLSTPRSCGTFLGASVLEAASAETTPSAVDLPLTIDRDCADPSTLVPTVDAAFGTAEAGAEGRPTFTVARPDRSARFNRIVVHLPPGLLASLKGVPECAPTDAATGACPEATRVGTVTSAAGVGPHPATAPPGALYLTGRPDGAVAGLVIVASVQFGSVDLGKLVVQARVDLRPADYGLDLVAEVPVTFLDIPLNLRSLVIALDRPGFSKNPTSCRPLSLAADLMADQGSEFAVASGVQMVGCDRLPFSPTLTASLPAETKPGDSAGVNVGLAAPGLQSGYARVKVTLPEGLGADISRLKRACPVAEFRASGCADSALTGRAAGTLGILDEGIVGRVVLVSYPGESLPGIGLDITGRFSARIEGHTKVEPSGRVSVTLDHLPDAPITDLALTLAPGDASVLKVSSLFCPEGRANFDVSILAQNGATLDRTVSSPCASRARRATVSGVLRGRRTSRPTLTLKAAVAAGPNLAGYRISFPKEVSGRSREIRKRLAVSGGRVLSASRRTIRVALTGAGRRSVTVKFGVGTLRLSPRARRSSRSVTITVTLRYGDGTAERRAVRVG